LLVLLWLILLPVVLIFFETGPEQFHISNFDHVDGDYRHTGKVDVAYYVAHCLTSALALQTMEKMLIDVSSALTELGAVYWLEQGTLLGAFRFASLLPYDDDVDLGMMVDEFDRVKARLERMLRNMSYSVFHFDQEQPRSLLVQIFPITPSVALADAIPVGDELNGAAAGNSYSKSVPELHLDIFLYRHLSAEERIARDAAASIDEEDTSSVRKKKKENRLRRQRLAERRTKEEQQDALGGPILRLVSDSWHRRFTTLFSSYAYYEGIPETDIFCRAAEPSEVSGSRAPRGLALLEVNGGPFPVPCNPLRALRTTVSAKLSLTHFLMEQHHGGTCQGSRAITFDIIMHNNASLFGMMRHLEGAFGSDALRASNVQPQRVGNPIFRANSSRLYHLSLCAAAVLHAERRDDSGSSNALHLFCRSLPAKQWATVVERFSKVPLDLELPLRIF
jgi:hypothetical protein